MDIFEYEEVRWPTRALQQEEEEQAVGTAAAALQPPQIHWSDGTQRITQPQLLVVAMSSASSTLLEAALAGNQVIATIQPAPAPMDQSQHSTEDADKAPSPHTTPRTTATAQLYAVEDKNNNSSSSSGSLAAVLVCCCRGTITADAAPAWARGLLQQLQPQQLLLIGTMQADQYRGDADPSQDFTAYLLHTSAAATAGTEDPSPKTSIPFLPSGSLVAGLPAALITQAELQGIFAQLVVVVETVPALVPETLHDLSRVVCRLLTGGESSRQLLSGLVGRLQQASVIEQARTKLQQTTCRPTSVYS
eukprot:GHUV01005465.1.p1 GENE.GHUV01005465.1~~GHUV01005465.1.p1  ORF type:complete len:305 (+),score=97.17 GHUV01005465.1:209-1123(+)